MCVYDRLMNAQRDDGTHTHTSRHGARILRRISRQIIGPTHTRVYGTRRTPAAHHLDEHIGKATMMCVKVNVVLACVSRATRLAHTLGTRR